MHQGFTLVELLIVVIIIGILASVGIVQYGTVIEKSRGAEAYSVLADIVAAEKAYFVDNDAYTTDISSLHSFTAPPASNNFTFSVPSANSNSGYAQAAKVSAVGGRRSYGMCLSSGRRASCGGAACNPICP